MDPSALIFIALAVAWAVYLIPKALEHHEESVRSRTVERFSATMRVLARREPVSRRSARLVPARSSADAGRQTAARGLSAPSPTPARRAAARAARRRRRVVAVILLSVVAVAGLAVAHVLAWPWVAVPVAVLAVWLVACRLMVKRERRPVRPARADSPRPSARPATPAPSATASRDDAADDPDRTDQLDAVPAPAGATESSETTGTTGTTEQAEPGSWDPVPVTLPTYVSKPVATRSVRTIDLDATGVWTSGRSESDSELVREADARAVEKQDGGSAKRRRRA